MGIFDDGTDPEEMGLIGSLSVSFAEEERELASPEKELDPLDEPPEEVKLGPFRRKRCSSRWGGLAAVRVSCSSKTHQGIELPEIAIQVKQVVLKKGQCSGCGRWVKAQLPKEYQTGYSPRFSALVAELSGIQEISRQAVERFIQKVFDVPISTGGIQKLIDRVS